MQQIGVWGHPQKRILAFQHIQTYDFARFAIGHDLEGAAADFTIGCKPLCADSCVNHQLKSLATVGATHVFRNLHRENIQLFPNSGCGFCVFCWLRRIP